MCEVGVNVVWIGEFVWFVMELEEGKIDVSFFKEIIICLYDNGIEMIMCMLMFILLIWLLYGWLECMYVNEKREVMGYGFCQYVCMNNLYF